MMRRRLGRRVGGLPQAHAVDEDTHRRLRASGRCRLASGVPFTEYVAGWLWFGLLGGAAAWSATVVVARRLSWDAGSAAVAWGVLGLAALAVSVGLPLSLGVLSPATAGATSVIVAAVSTFALRPSAAAPALEAPRGRPASRAALLAVAFITLVAGAVLLAYLREAVSRPVEDLDSTSFILPTVGQWLRSGSLWETRDFVAGWAFAAYPNTGGLVQAAAMLPWQSDFAIRAVGPAFMLLGALATYALAAELGANRATALGAALLGLLLPAAMVSGVSNAQTDALAAAGVVAARFSSSRHARTGATAELVLAALALGIAFGTKWYGPPQVAAVLAVWLAVRLRARDARIPALGRA